MNEAHALHSQMQEMKSQFAGLDKEREQMPKEIALKEASLKFLEQRNRIMKEINLEKKQKLQEERHALDDLQNRVFQEKRCLCSRVHEFSDKYGLLAIVKNPSGFAVQHKRCLNSSQGTCIYMAKDERKLKSVVAELEAELSVTYSNLEVSRLHLASVQEEHFRLLHSADDEDECNDLQDLKQQTKLLEEQCEAVQQELGWQYLILKQAAKTENSGQKADNTEQVAETLDNTAMVVAKVTTASENSMVEHLQQTVPAEPSKPTSRPFVPKIPSKMSLRVTLHRSRDLEKQLSERLSSAKPPPKSGKL